MSLEPRRTGSGARALLIAAACLVIVGSSRLGRTQEETADPPEVTLGERLFLETRFAQFFKQFLDGGGDVNAEVPAGDPVVDFSESTGAPFEGPFRGASMNCRSCHLVDELVGMPGAGMRSYNDFARRSPVPERLDGARSAVRNAPPLVNASLPRAAGLLLHSDGEFATLPALIRATFTGRNFGWLPRESGQAVAHIARVIREDDGTGALAQDFGGLAYSTVLAGTDPSIPKELRLPRGFRLNVASASDRQILEAVARLVAAYTGQLVFSQDASGSFNLSPFDVFLNLNGLPRRPASRESEIDYARRFLRAIRSRERIGALRFVQSNPNSDSGAFEFHDQPFRFGVQELAGLKVFFGEPAHVPLRPGDIATAKTGNCIACHAPPNFTDFRFHNTGVTQLEYDAVHGTGSFAQLPIPSLSERLRRPEEFLPATPQHPDATGRFRAVPSVSDPSLADLGLWNVMANPDFPDPQVRIGNLLCQDAQHDRAPQGFLRSRRCLPGALLPLSIARFKTPGLRDLSHSGPYMHNGGFDRLQDVIGLYSVVAGMSRGGRLRNGAPQLAGIALAPEDVEPLVSFLRSLNEDYQ